MLPYYFLGASEFLDRLRTVRIMLLMGSLRSGKTLFSVAMGYHLLSNGNVCRAAFNFPVSFGDAPFPRWTYAVIDEAGVAFDKRESFKQQLANKFTRESTFRLGKLGSYLVIPTFLESDKRFRVGMRVWRVKKFADLLWLYTWELGPEAKEDRRLDINYWTGRLWFVNPRAFFGVYDTYFTPWPNLTLDFLSHFIEGDL